MDAMIGALRSLLLSVLATSCLTHVRQNLTEEARAEARSVIESEKIKLKAELDEAKRAKERCDIENMNLRNEKLTRAAEAESRRKEEEEEEERRRQEERHHEEGRRRMRESHVRSRERSHDAGPSQAYRTGNYSDFDTDDHSEAEDYIRRNPSRRGGSHMYQQARYRGTRPVHPSYFRTP
ncbi:hypothetical protein BX600DRAFT_533065 [Xylariales sp. PMI_506]|nr:hypothetical protein BX600DRAFT_533065 [Xylariales sp. PMI_506]